MNDKGAFWIAYRREPDGSLRAIAEVEPTCEKPTPEEVLREAQEVFPSTVEVRRFELDT